MIRQTIILVALLAGLWPFRAQAHFLVRPKYGIESTITNSTLTDLCYKKDLQLFMHTEAAVRENPSRIHLWAETFPAQYDVFDRFAHQTCTEAPFFVQPHKEAFPSVTKRFADGYWLRFQFEYQALELQAEPLILPHHLAQVPRIDHEFFERGLSSGLDLKPSRYWGMGHLHESMSLEGISLRPLVIRNRLIEELNEAAFWELVGPDIGAPNTWTVNRSTLIDLQAWLPKYDGWIAHWSFEPGVMNFEIMKQMSRSIVRDAVFREQRPEHQTFMLDQISRTFVINRRQDFNRLMHNFMVVAFYSSQPDQPTAVTLRKKTLEFRRIPAHAHGDEAAMWMALLEGRWRRAYRSRKPIPLIPPDPRDDHPLKQFKRYIEGARMNPLDFVHFLPDKLRAQAELIQSSKPRWPEIRRGLCEELLKQSPQFGLPSGDE